MHCDGASPLIANNTITANSAVFGGGIWCNGCSPQVTNNTITGNDASAKGGGIFCFYSYPLFADNIIQANSSGSGGGISCNSTFCTINGNTIMENIVSGGGGGICCNGGSPTITHNVITANSAEDGGGILCNDSASMISCNAIMVNSGSYSGGGISCNDHSSPTIVGNTISGNKSMYGGGGGILSWHYCSPMIVNNAITANSTMGHGGGISCSNASSSVIINNTIAANMAEGYGGGIHASSSSFAVVNTIIAFNSSGLYIFGGNPFLQYCSVYDNTAYNYFGLTDPTGMDGNISADPLFVRNPDNGDDGWGDDPATTDIDEAANDDFGDVRLATGSPCIDAGSNSLVPTDVTDLDGDGDTAEAVPYDLTGRFRFYNDPATADTGSGVAPIVDMGAYEYGPDECGDAHHVPPVGDFNADCRVEWADFGFFASRWQQTGCAYPDWCNGADMSRNGEVTWLDFAVFAEHWRECTAPECD